jgi:hypothetical protein
MIDLITVKLPKGDAILLTAEIGAAVSDINNAKFTVIYTDTFPEGITIDMPISKFYELWIECLISDVELIEIELPDEKEVH